VGGRNEIALCGITWDHPRGYQPLAASIGPYAAAFGVRITWEKRSLKDFGDASIGALADLYDLLVIDHPHVGMAADCECLLPLDTCLDPGVLATLARQSAGPSHASYSYAGHQWALAVDAAMQTSAYRPDLLDEPLPHTWQDVLALGTRLRSRDRFIAIPLVPTDCICSFLTLCASQDDPPGHVDRLVSEETGRTALQWLVDASALCHPDSLEWNPIRMLDHMGRADDIAYCPLTFCYSNYARTGYVPKWVRFAMIPNGQGSLLGGAGFAVSARCAQPEAACEYGAWLCSAEIQGTLYVENGGQPGNGVVWLDAAANALTNGFFRDTWDTLRQAYVRPRHRGFVTFQEAGGNVIHRLLRGQGTVEGCLDNLMELYEQSLPG
jgi:multiple sugar transport system substrate-binding protein